MECHFYADDTQILFYLNKLSLPAMTEVIIITTDLNLLSTVARKHSMY